MNRGVVIIGLLFISSLPGFSQAPEEVFREANQLYQDSMFEKARDAYESIIRNGFESGYLYYNLGNTYYRLGDIGRTILNYERGLRLAPKDEDIRYNLALSRVLTVDKIEPAPRLFFWDYWDDVKGSFSAEEIAWITYAAYFAALTGLTLAFVGRGMTFRKIGFFTFIAGGLFFVLLITISIARFSDLNRTDVAIVTSQISTAKNSPDENSTDAFVLHAGTKVLIVEKVGDWMMIRLEDGKTGWMAMDAAEVI